MIRLYDLAECNSYEGEFRKNHRDWVTEALNSGENIRDSKWTQSIAVGSENFIDNIKEDLVLSAKGRKVVCSKDIFQLRETPVPYNADFDTKKSDIGSENGYLWK